MTYRIIGVLGLVLAATAASAQTAPKPPSEISITNGRSVPATDVAVSVDQTTLRLPKALAPKAKASLKLPKMQGCMVGILASFEDESVVELGEYDVCKDRNVRFTD
jgi:hypothetical protein